MFVGPSVVRLSHAKITLLGTRRAVLYHSSTTWSANKWKDVEVPIGQEKWIDVTTVTKQVESTPKSQNEIRWNSLVEENSKFNPAQQNLLEKKDRKWIDFNYQEEVVGDKISVVTYNVLSDSIKDSLELKAAKKRVPYEKRNVLILLELLELNADVICLQEVEIQLFRDLFLPQLAAAGYSGIHAVKPLDLLDFETSRQWTENRLDGCAIFWKKKKGKESTELRQTIYNDPSKFGITNHNFMKTYVQKRNIILMAYLECRKDTKDTKDSKETKTEGPKNRFIIANTHLLRNISNVSPITLAQAKAVTTSIKKMVGEKKDVAVLLCGDFNAQPDSAVYKFLNSGNLPASDPALTFDKHSLLPKQGRFNLSEFPQAYSDKLAHDLDLASLYGATVGEPPCTASWMTLDYIWFNRNRFRPTGLLLTPQNKKSFTDLPNEVYPSDHLPLVGEFLLIPPVVVPEIEKETEDKSSNEDKRYSETREHKNEVRRGEMEGKKPSRGPKKSSTPERANKRTRSTARKQSATE